MLYRVVISAAIGTLLAISSSAYADSVSVEFAPAPGASIFAVQVNDKTIACEIVSSVEARGPKGCNFVIGIGANGMLERQSMRDSNAGCSLVCN